MSKTSLIFKNEIKKTVLSKSFQFIVLGIPLIAILVFFVIFLIKREKSPSASGSKKDGGKKQELQTEGYVDHPGLIKEIPKDVPEGNLLFFASEESAQKALQKGDISAFYIVPPNFLKKGELIYINPSFNMITTRKQSWIMRRTLTANLLGNDPERIKAFRRVMDIKTTAFSPVKKRDKSSPLTFLVPYFTTLITAVSILFSASLLLHSIAEEKKNRVMEVLLVSVKPIQMLTGKIIALGLLGFLQALVWVGTGYGILSVGTGMLEKAGAMNIPPSIMVWAFAFIVCGYSLYASLMAGLGALAPNLKEASQATFFVIWPIILSFILIGYLIDYPHCALGVGLSLFPLTSPVIMMMRLASGGVPFWQPVLAIFLLICADIFIIRSVSRIFHAMVLLSGQPFSVKRFYRALLG